jgi:hypothetical protein
MRKKLLYIIGVAVIMLVVVMGLLFHISSRSVIPVNIKEQLDILVFLPKESGSLRIDRPTFKYDASLKVMSVVVGSYGIKNTVSEQPTPDAFNDIPGYYDKLTERLNTYANFDTELGRVYLTRPVELKGKQSAIMNGKGTLMFASPDKDLTSSQWRRFFNSLQIIRP